MEMDRKETSSRKLTALQLRQRGSFLKEAHSSAVKTERKLSEGYS